VGPILSNGAQPFLLNLGVSSSRLSRHSAVDVEVYQNIDSLSGHSVCLGGALKELIETDGSFKDGGR
jgi:hypothetical protein